MNSFKNSDVKGFAFKINDILVQTPISSKNDNRLSTILNTIQLQQIAPKATVKPTSKTLVSYSQHRITPTGFVTLTVNTKTGKQIYSSTSSILSGKEGQALNLIQRVHKIDTSLQELLNQHPELEQASGAMPGTYTIKIDPTAMPVVHGPRRQPAALLLKIKKKLKEMESEGHLARVTQPTDWVNSIVISIRGDKIRICLDPADINKSEARTLPDTFGGGNCGQNTRCQVLYCLGC